MGYGSLDEFSQAVWRTLQAASGAAPAETSASAAASVAIAFGVTGVFSQAVWGGDVPGGLRCRGALKRGLCADIL